MLRNLRSLRFLLVLTLLGAPPAQAAPGGVQDASAAEFLYQLAQDYQMAGLVDEAIHELHKLLLIDPHHARARRALGELESLKRWERDRAIEQGIAEAQQRLGVSEPRSEVPVRAVSPPLGERRAQPPPDAGPPAGRRGIVKTINDTMAPLAISGEIRSSAGITRDDVTVEQANGDLNERNFRIFTGPFRYNTFDPRVFSRFRLNVDTTEASGWQLHSNTTVDPWSFVGTTERVTVVGKTPTDSVEVQLKWWAPNNSAINETVLTLTNGDAIALPEIEVKDGNTVASRVTSTFGNVFNIPSLDIDYTFQPVRWFWTGYRSDALDLRIFPLALEDQAMTSDDPLHLSNHHIYWEPSPWLDEWQPGRLNTGASPDDFTRGAWSDELSFFTRDSDLTRLTALRGTSLQWFATDSTTIQAAVASPKGLWQEYESFNSAVGMVRLKQDLLRDRFSLGGLYTTRVGFHKRSRDATNHVFSMDSALTPVDGTTLSAQGAVSQTIQDRTSPVENDFGGWAWHAGVQSRLWSERLMARLFYTHMDDSFDPGLASFRQTRKDQFWGRHLKFKRRLRLIDTISPASAVSPEELDAVRIGDGVDLGRDAVGLRLSGSWWDHRVEPLVDVRNVHTTEGKYVETVVRNENTLRPFSWLTAKTLILYHDLPQTTAGLDPLIIDDDTGTPFLNAAIVDDRDPSLQTYSLGAELAPADWLSCWAAWERTNDSTLATGNFPRGLLNSSSFGTATEEGSVIRSKVPFLFSQGFFPQPPYPFFDVVRAGASVSPWDSLELSVDWTRNEFEHAGQIDDNLNHAGFTAAWSPLKRLVLVGRYVASWAIDITNENAGRGAKFVSHHNAYGRLLWRVHDDSELSVEYGVASLGSAGTLFSTDPTGDSYPTLDTEHLVRILFSTSF